MTLFSVLEKLGGKPRELYVFQRGTEAWRYTDARSPIVVSSLTYHPAVVARSAVTDSQEEAQSSVTVTIDRQLPVVAAMFMSDQNYRQCTLTIFRYQPGASDMALIARGRISSARWRGASVEVTFTQTPSLLQQPVPRLTYLPTCNHTVYDEFCQQNAVDFTWNGTVTALYAKGAVGGSPDGPSFAIAASSAPYNQAGYFTAGYVDLSSPATDPRFVIAHTVAGGNALIVLMTDLPSAVVVGSTLHLTAGCDGAIGTCSAKFANLAHFLGFPYMPTKNPFTQGLN